jgi:hypothetical protein
MQARQVAKILRAKPTEETAKKFLERITYRYLMRVLDKVILEYNISRTDAEILRDKFVNMNIIEVIEEEEDAPPV